MIREIKGYRYGDGESPVKKDDHAMDELRYFIMSRPEPAVFRPAQSTIVQKDLLRLMKRRRR